MLDPKTLEDIGNKMSTLLANSPAKDFEKNAKAVVSGFLAKLDLVTREEFDIQTHVLARTREKLKELEARVEALEKVKAEIGGDSPILPCNLSDSAAVDALVGQAEAASAKRATNSSACCRRGNVAKP